MTKADLKTGMVVNLRNGDSYVVVKEVGDGCYEYDIIFRKNSWIDLNSYTDDFKCEANPANDIMEVRGGGIFYFIKGIENTVYRGNILLWERKEKKKYTYAQLKEMLGEEFEIVKE